MCYMNDMPLYACAFASASVHFRHSCVHVACTAGTAYPACESAPNLFSSGLAHAAAMHKEGFS